MKKTLIATFGGVLASGFLMLSAPLAHSQPLPPGCAQPASPAIAQDCQNIANLPGPGDDAATRACKTAAQHSGLPCTMP